MENKRIPKELESAIHALRDGYQTSEHGFMDKSNNAALVDEYGLRDYLAGAIRHRRHARRMPGRGWKTSKTWGVKGLRINNNLPDRTVFMNAWAKEVRGVA